MAVFGIPVTNKTLEGMPEYEGKAIGAVDRARVALNLKNSEGKDVRARQYVQDLMEKAGVAVATHILIYNATGNTIEYASHIDWDSGLGAGPFPVIIQNGQWGAYLHRQNSNGNVSSAAIAYRGTNADDGVCEWMLSWRTRSGTNDNRLYTEIGDMNYFNSRWEQVRQNMLISDVVSKFERNGCLSFLTMGNFSYSLCEATFTLSDAYKNLAE